MNTQKPSSSPPKTASSALMVVVVLVDMVVNGGMSFSFLGNVWNEHDDGGDDRV
jgi:hypothetical protein